VEKVDVDVPWSGKVDSQALHAASFLSLMLFHSATTQSSLFKRFVKPVGIHKDG
jgi:hypothetical protein